MSKIKPRVSIGLPVYNGENFIRDALNSVLAQTFKDFELIISDNASTDATEEICREYATQDSRIHYYRQEQNLGAAPNFNRVFELSQGEFFKWIAHDDTCSPTFLEEAVAIFDNNPDITLCYSKPKIINAQSQAMDENDELYDWVKDGKASLNTDSPYPHKRFYEIFGSHPNYPIFGLIRASTLANISSQPLGSYSGADRVLLARISLCGRFYEFQEELMSFRRHTSQSIHALLLHDSSYEYSLWFDTSNKEKIVLPLYSFISEILYGINLAPLSWGEKIFCYSQLTKPPFPLILKSMVKELFIGGQLLLKRYTTKRF